MFHVSYVFPPPALVPLVLSNSWQNMSNNSRHLILVARCWMEAPFPTILNMLADIPQHCPIIKHLIMDVFVGLFLQHHAAIFLPVSGGKTDWPDHLPPQIPTDSHSNVNPYQFFIWRLIWGILNLLGRSLMDCMWPVFLGNNMQHRSVLKPFLLGKESSLLLKHMSPGSLWGAAASATLAAGVSLMSIPQADDWTRVSPDRHYFPPTLLLQIGTRILSSVLHRASVSRCSLGKCQTLTYIVL